MEASPGAALDLPVKVLVWADDAGLANRHGVAAHVAGPLSAAEVVTGRVAGPAWARL